MGHTEEQAEDELREAVARPALLLRQEHYTQDCRQALRLPVRLRPADTAWVRYHLYLLLLIFENLTINERNVAVSQNRLE